MHNSDVGKSSSTSSIDSEFGHVSDNCATSPLDDKSNTIELLDTLGSGQQQLSFTSFISNNDALNFQYSG